VPHALTHGAPVFVHGVLKSQSPALRAEVVLEGAPVLDVDQVLDVSPALNSEWAPKRGPSHQSHVVLCRDTYGQARVYSCLRRNVDRPRQMSFCGQVLACTESVTSEYHKSRLCLSVLVHYWGQLARAKVVLEVLR